MQFGDRLKLLREHNNLTQLELGKLIGVSDRVIGYYEANNRFPKSPETLKKICEIFDVSADYMIGMESKNQKPEEIKRQIIKLLGRL